MLKLSGKCVFVSDIRNVKEYQLVEFVIDSWVIPSGCRQPTRVVCTMFLGNGTKLPVVGMGYDVAVNPEAREYNGKWYQSMKVVECRLQEGYDAPSGGEDEWKDVEDDLPF